MIPNYDVSELSLTVNATGWVLGTSRLGHTTRLSADTSTALTKLDISSLSLTEECTVEDTLHITPTISRMTITTPTPDAQNLPTRATVTLAYRGQRMWQGLLRTMTRQGVKRPGRPTVWLTTLEVEGPEQALESRTATIPANASFEGISTLYEHGGIAVTPVGGHDAWGRVLAQHLPPHGEISESKLALLRRLAVQSGCGLVGYNHYAGGVELRHAEDAPAFYSGAIEPSDATVGRVPETGAVHFTATQGATEADPPEYITFSETDDTPGGYTVFSGFESTEITPMLTRYDAPRYLSMLPVVRSDTNAVEGITAPFKESTMTTADSGDGLIYQPLPWRGVVDFHDGAGDVATVVTAVTHDIDPTGWTLRLACARDSLLNRYNGTGVSPRIPGAIRDIAVSSASAGHLTVEWGGYDGYVANPYVLVGILRGDFGALNPFIGARAVADGGLLQWQIVSRVDAVCTFAGLAAGTYTAQVWHLSMPGESFLSGVDTTIPGIEDDDGRRYSIGGHSRTLAHVVS